MPNPRGDLPLDACNSREEIEAWLAAFGGGVKAPNYYCPESRAAALKRMEAIARNDAPLRGALREVVDALRYTRDNETTPDNLNDILCRAEAAYYDHAYVPGSEGPCQVCGDVHPAEHLKNPVWTEEVKKRCRETCGEFGDPPCYALPGLSSDAPKNLKPCLQCQRGPVEGHHEALATAPEAPDSGWQTIETAPAATHSFGKVWVVGGRYQNPELVDPDGEWWRHILASDPQTAKHLPTHWALCQPPALAAQSTGGGGVDGEGK